jgi:transposase-like protein DUF772
MRPRERRETSEQDLFRSRLDQIIDMKHALVKLARAIDWRFLEQTFGAVYTDKPGQPPLPTRLMAGLAILKHTYDLSDEALCDRWVENPYFQYFCGEEFFQHALVFDRSSLTRWRQRMGEIPLARHLSAPAREIVCPLFPHKKKYGLWPAPRIDLARSMRSPFGHAPRQISSLKPLRSIRPERLHRRQPISCSKLDASDQWPPQ